jgi:hypothetical protein
MKLNLKKENFPLNFQKIVIVIALFILIILSIKSGGSVSQQNVSTTVLPENNNKVENITETKNPYQLAYEKCTHPKMSKEFEDKCVAWELKSKGIK